MMNIFALVFALGIAVRVWAGEKEAPDWQQRIFCVRHRHILDQIYQGAHPQLEFYLSNFRQTGQSSIGFDIQTRQHSLFLAPHLRVALSFYEGGSVLEVSIDEVGVPSGHQRYKYTGNLPEEGLEAAQIQSISKGAQSITVFLKEAKYVV